MGCFGVVTADYFVMRLCCPFAHFRKGRGIKALRGKVSDNFDNLSKDGQLQGRLRAVFEIAGDHPWKLVQSGLMIFP
jgi:hypothetical protein